MKRFLALLELFASHHHHQKKEQKKINHNQSQTAKHQQNPQLQINQSILAVRASQLPRLYLLQ
jgi:hypothetical protein